MSYFSIQISNPHVSQNPSNDLETIEEAIEEIFALQTEDAYVNWNGIRIPINYKYDASSIIMDAVDMVSSILESESGKLVIDWSSSSFRGKWIVSWTGSELSCNSEWHSVSGQIESVLNSKPKISLSKGDFVSEWAGMLGFIQSSLEKAKVTHVTGYEELATVCSKIPPHSNRGQLYRQYTIVD